MKEIKNILVLTPLYPADDLPKENTPVVHYFTRQWAKEGYNVVVINYPYNFPKLVLNLTKPFLGRIKQHFGMAVVRTTYLKETEYELDGVRVKRIPLKKVKPHGRYSRKEIERSFERSIQYLESVGFVPDVITSHWANPTFDLIPLFKEKYDVPICYVDHLAGRDIVNTYKDDAEKIINNIDLIGYRSRYIKQTFEQLYGSRKSSFYCYSGIPEEFLPKETYKRTFDKVKSFVYVGTLIKRKFPAEIIPALNEAFGDDDFTMRYIGRGNEETEIRNQIAKYQAEKEVEICGYMPREEVVNNLDQSDVFVMMSRSETFGLVYLEAMARGCITIASWREGFDGIIEDGVNGFLCEAGNSNDLARIIKKIRKMSVSELNKISQNAMQTARELTDKKVARLYLDNLKGIIKIR